MSTGRASSTSGWVWQRRAARWRSHGRAFSFLEDGDGVNTRTWAELAVGAHAVAAALSELPPNTASWSASRNRARWCDWLPRSATRPRLTGRGADAGESSRSTLRCESTLVHNFALFPASKLRRQDSNLNSQNQNLMCSRLHHDGPRISGEPIGRRRPATGSAAHTDAFVRL